MVPGWLGHRHVSCPPPTAPRVPWEVFFVSFLATSNHGRAGIIADTAVQTPEGPLGVDGSCGRVGHRLVKQRNEFDL